MTFEQETKQISDFLRANCGRFAPSGILTNAAERLDAQAHLLEAFEDEMRALASESGAGGYNAEIVDPKVFAEKIRWGINHIIDVQANQLDAAKKRIAELEETIKALTANRCAKCGHDWFHSFYDGFYCQKCRTKLEVKGGEQC